MSAPVLEVDGVEVRYDEQCVLDVPALTVEPGEVLAVIGPNGAGKSTLLHVLALLARPTRGTVRFHGVAPRTEAERLAWRRRMACVFQEPLLSRGSVLYNTLLACRLVTGRTHQLRVHCAEIGCPILGDGKYGGEEALLSAVADARRLHLHARRLVLPHPSGKGELAIDAQPPPHFRRTVEAFGFSFDAV